jgi:hypothetical protein
MYIDRSLNFKCQWKDLYQKQNYIYDNYFIMYMDFSFMNRYVELLSQVTKQWIMYVMVFDSVNCKPIFSHGYFIFQFFCN